MTGLISSLTVPLLIAGTALCGLLKKVDVFSVFVRGAGRGIGVVLRILPPSRRF